MRVVYSIKHRDNGHGPRQCAYTAWLMLLKCVRLMMMMMRSFFAFTLVMCRLVVLKEVYYIINIYKYVRGVPT